MKHVNVTQPMPRGQSGALLAEFIITVSSNSFGDQILTLRQLTTEEKGDFVETSYKEIDTTSFPEGSHMDEDCIKDFGCDWIHVI